MTTSDELLLAQAGIDAIAKIIAAIDSAKAGKTDPAVVLASFAKTHEALDANNATIDAEIAAKYLAP